MRSRATCFIRSTNRPPTIDYPFSVIDMQFGTDGKGEGTLSLAARIIPAGKNIVVENYDMDIARLMVAGALEMQERMVREMVASAAKPMR